ncbi:MAG: tRNA (adenine(22)-N(1))-methyltransferase TrmK [Porticoccaceae bacterium]|nr:tRNA (adenine(22)-N(1))-methyltransferase TrmK [Porticoccaceae bacterium]
MIKNKRLLKSGSRLSHLANMVESPYTTIWDCCCDHGLLGMSLLRDQYAEELIFVDVVEDILANLTTQLERSFPQDQYSWQVRCEDINNIIVPPVDSQLFIIAGVGPHQTIEFINSLCASAPDTIFDLLICCVHGSYSVRQALIKKGYGLKNEQIIFENNRFYEAIYVSKKVADKTIVNTGSQMWNWSDPVHQDYWHRVVGHYRQKAKSDPEQFQPIVKHYEILQKAWLALD